MPILSTTHALHSATSPEITTSKLIEELRPHLQRAISRIEKKIDGQRSQLKKLEELREGKTIGDALVAISSQHPRPGLSSIEVDDWSEGNETPKRICVSLDPTKTVLENAEDYFTKFKKANRGISQVHMLVSSSEEELKVLRNDLAWMDSVTGDVQPSLFDTDQIRLIRERLIKVGALKVDAKPSTKPKEMDKDTRKYGKGIDVFISPSGYEVIAGRSAEANERVSFELTGPDQVWFHVSDGIPGSHVLLRCLFKAAPQEDIIFAAKIAARFSGAKGKQRSVRVMYCQGKALKRPPARMAKPGLVLIEGKSKEVTVPVTEE